MYSKAYHPSDLKTYSFLVTGGAGFIGSHIVEYLVKHQAGKIRIVDNLATGFLENIQSHLTLPNVEFIEGDICDFNICKQACQGIDYVLHQAALGSVPRSIEFPIASNQVNVSGFLNVLTAARETRVRRFVYASSSSVYGDSKQLPKVEENIGNQLSPYAVSKRVNELYADVYAKVYNMEVIGLRYFNIFGPRQNPKGSYAAAIPLFMEALLHNRSPFIYGDGNQTRDFTFVENAVQANIKAVFTLEKEAVGKVFNIAYGDRTSILDMFTILKKLTGASVEAQFKKERVGDVKDSLANINAAYNLLGYQPQTDFEEGLKLTLKWFKSRY